MASADEIREICARLLVAQTQEEFRATLSELRIAVAPLDESPAPPKPKPAILQMKLPRHRAENR